MFIGHGLLAFAIAAGVAASVGWPRERAIAVGVCAGAFATVPDVDIVYAPVGLLGASGVSEAVTGFWSTGNLVHRAVTHSLLVGSVAAVAFGLWAVRGVGTWPEDRSGSSGGRIDRSRPIERGAAAVALALLCGLIVVAAVESGALGAFVMTVFVGAGLIVTTVATRQGLSAGTIGGAALVGMLTHPFGDVFTGAPPAFLYPLDATLLADRIALSADPTFALLGAFWIELGTIWLAAIVYAALAERRLRDCLDWRAAFGVAYAGAALALPAPTLDTSYHFVFGALAVGAVLGVSPIARSGGRAKRGGTVDRSVLERRAPIRAVGRVANAGSSSLQALREDPFAASTTGLTAVTLAVTTYALAYAYAAL